MIEFKTMLYPWQQAAVDKLSKLKVAALYMEQGTGKTRTALELIAQRVNAGKVNHVIWFCPCSVKANLAEDITKHVGNIPDYITIAGIESISESDRLYLELSDLVNNKKVFLVVDESTLVKNHQALRTGRIINLAGHVQYKMLLNGTPVTKNEADLFAQWYILDWRILGYRSYWSFAANHLEYYRLRLPDGREFVDKSRIKRVLHVDYLTAKIDPYTYQITKKECMKQLPAKNYCVAYCQMTEEQALEYYDTKYRYLLNIDEFKSETIYKLFTALQHVAAGRRVLSEPDEKMETEPMFDWHTSPRIDRLMQLIKVKVGSEKCIIFAKYQAEIDDIIAALTAEFGEGCCVEFTGRISQKHRQENRLRFKDDVQFFVANRACGAYGLNLQFCHNIIYYSNDFDWGTRAQSEDRVHRIGQAHEVNIWDIVVDGTIDERIASCLYKKENLVEKFKKELERFKCQKSELLKCL